MSTMHGDGDTNEVGAGAGDQGVSGSDVDGTGFALVSDALEWVGFPGASEAGDADADVVVIGAGHNALVCAGYLAAAGLSVTLLEAAEEIGGNTITEELTLPGWRHDSCSSAHVVLQANPLIRDDELGLLSRYGLRYLHTDPAVVLPVGAMGAVSSASAGSPGGSAGLGGSGGAAGSEGFGGSGGSGGDDALVMHRSVHATSVELARWSPVDATALRWMMADWQDGLATAHARWSAGLPPADDDASRRYEALRQRSAWEVVHTTFQHPVARAMVSWLAFATIQPPARPGTGALPAAITSGRLRYGWATPVGGSGALPAALARYLADHGGTVVTSAPVTRILTEHSRATGVVTADGRRFRARRAVVSSAHLTQLPALLPGTMPPALTAAVGAWTPGLALFAVHLALRGDIRYRAREGARTAVAGGLGSPDGLRRQVEGCFQGRLEEQDPWLLLVSSTVVDPDRAPRGGGILKLLTAAPSRLAGEGDWDESVSKAYAERLIMLASRHVDGLEPADILAVLAESPADLARRNGHNVGGSCHGGEFDLRDGGVVPGWPEYRTPLAGLYLTGATTHPGGSVSGRPGRNTARCLLTDVGIDPASVMPGL